MQKSPDESRVDAISKLLDKIDSDKDGQLKVDDVLKLIETVGHDSVDLSEKQVGELIDLITKEEHLENEEKIEKALAKSKVARSTTTTTEATTESTTDTLKDTAKVLSADDKKTPTAGDDKSKLKQASKVSKDE